MDMYAFISSIKDNALAGGASHLASSPRSCVLLLLLLEAAVRGWCVGTDRSAESVGQLAVQHFRLLQSRGLELSSRNSAGSASGNQRSTAACADSMAALIVPIS